MAEEILSAHAERLAFVTILPSGGGRFEITAGGKPVFSKKETGRFPAKGEIEQLLAAFL